MAENHGIPEELSPELHQALEETGETTPNFTRLEIARVNANERSQQVLVPLGDQVYDLKHLYHSVKSQLIEMIPDRVSIDYANKMLDKTSKKPSTYLGLIATCKFLGVSNENIDALKKTCFRGSLEEIPMDKSEQQFREDLTGVVESLMEEYGEVLQNGHLNGHRHIGVFMENCRDWLANTHTMFEDKMLPPANKYQDDMPFPKPKLGHSKEKIRKDFFHGYTEEEKITYVKTQAALAIEGINKTIDDYKAKLDSFGEPSHCKIIEYVLAYSKVFLNSCEVQQRHGTMLLPKDIPRNTDPNLLEFPLPNYSKTKQMRLFLEDWQPLDLVLTDNSSVWKCLPDTLEYQDKEEDVVKYFEDLLAQRCSEPFDTSMDEADLQQIWKDVDAHLIRDDEATEYQLLLIRSRQKRPDLFDKDKIRIRREKLLNYFVNKYGLTEEKVMRYRNWAATLEQSQKDFDEFCEGKFTPPKRPDFDKEKAYQERISSVPTVTPEMRDKIREIREKRLKYFAKRYQLSEDVVELYRCWAERLEHSAQALYELCDGHSSCCDKPDSVAISTNISAIFTNDSPFDEEFY